MQILQLGNGGGLNPRLVNSAFIIDLYDDHSEYLLFDCGFNIMVRLMDLEDEDEHFSIDKIKHVVISHNHADHMGSLETLIYWNFFKHGVKMDIYVPCKGLLKTVKATRKILDNFKTKKVDTYESLVKVCEGLDIHLFHENDIGLCDPTIITFSPAFHGAKETIGMRIHDKDTAIFISGDTKANRIIETFLKPYFYTDLIFHDYSNWDDESKNIHACKTDFEREYSYSFRNEIIPYHTGDLQFNRNWQ
jgi:ribonuclease BN (tRNA processing enzyme)